MKHVHRAKSEREIGWTHCVTPQACAARPARGNAHGNIVRVEICRCGAERRTEINGNAVNRGPWEKAGEKA